jgi:hypothetical protein
LEDEELDLLNPEEEESKIIAEVLKEPIEEQQKDIEPVLIEKKLMVSETVYHPLPQVEAPRSRQYKRGVNFDFENDLKHNDYTPISALTPYNFDW